MNRTAHTDSRGSAQGVAQPRALLCSALLACGLFATLAGAIVARDLVARAHTDQLQPFTAWLPASPIAAGAIMLAFSSVLGVAAYLLMTRFGRINATLARIKGPRVLGLRMTRRDVIAAALVIGVCWIPILAIMYPCGMTVDTYNQLYQFQSSAPTFYPTLRSVIDAEFIDHHPVFDTLLYGAFWQAGMLAGSQKAGLFALVILQSIVLASELGLSVCYLEVLKVPWPLRCASLLFFALFPFFGHYAATILKDVTYLTVYVPWFLIWMETARTHGAFLERKGALIAFFLLGGVCIITKKLGLFLLAPCLAGLLLVARAQRPKLAIGSIATIAVFCALIPAIVYPAIGGVAPGGKQETLGPVIQHLTALMIEEPDAVSPEERDDLYEVFYVDLAKHRYESFRTDGAKSTFRDSATSAEIAAMMRIWLQKGLEHPLVYLKSTLQTSGMLFVPFMKMTYYYDEDYQTQREIYCGYSHGFEAVDVDLSPELVELNAHLENDSVESKVSDLPVISLFFTEGFYGGWVPMIALVLTCAARCGQRCRTHFPAGVMRPFYLVALLPALLSVAFFLVSPVASPRYVLNLMYTAPLLLGWPWYALSLCGDAR